MCNETNQINSNEDLAIRIKEIENFIAGRAEAKKAMIRFPSSFSDDTDEDVPANVVIAEAFNQLKDVVIAGVDKEGKWWFSLSMGDGAYAMWIMEHFKKTLLETSPIIEYNEGREI